MKKILITGVAGFIGFNLANYFLIKKKYKIFGLDNINDYYSTKLKKDRIKILKTYNKFKFFKFDLIQKKKLASIFKNKFDIVIHLAGQAGVRYSINYPEKYLDSNMIGFFNILELCRHNKTKKLLYASSSSVYGDLKKFPLDEKEKLNPKNFYGYSKKNNEEMAKIYSQLYKLNTTGLRFFTVFGQWGRPDMFMMKYLKYLYIKNSKFHLYNFGNHVRDFTYVDDVIKIIFALCKKSSKKNYEIYNICSNKPKKITEIIRLINKYTNKYRSLKKVKLQVGDIHKTHGDNSKIRKNLKNIKFTKIETGIKKLIKWFKFYYKI